MKWAPEEERQIEKLLSELWPAELGEEAYYSYQRALGRYHGQTVITAIKRIADESDSRFRPRPATFTAVCGEIVKAKRREAGGPVDGRCPWCQDLWYVTAWAYPTAAPELAERGISPDCTKRIPGKDELLVVPEAARGAGLEAVEIRLACGHCEPRLASRSVTDWEKNFGRCFLEFRHSGRRAHEQTYDRCRQEETPPLSETCSLAEYLSSAGGNVYPEALESLKDAVPTAGEERKELPAERVEDILEEAPF